MTADLPSSANPLPPRTRLLLNLSTQSQLLDQFFSTLTNPTPTNASPLPNLYTLLQETTNDLLALRKDVVAHQEVWARIERKKKEVVDLEKRSRGLMRALRVESEELGVMVKEGREIMESVDKVQKSAFLTLKHWGEERNADDRSNPCAQTPGARSRPRQTFFSAYIEPSHTNR
jgi:hypothetical protein